MSRYIVAVLTAVCVLGGLVIVADIAMMLVLRSDNSHHAWYFPYSLLVGPIVIIALLLLWLARTFARRRQKHGRRDKQNHGAH